MTNRLVMYTAWILQTKEWFMTWLGWSWTVKDFIILLRIVHNLKLMNCSFLLNWNFLLNIFRLWKVKPRFREDTCIQHMSLCPYIGGMPSKGQVERVHVEPSGEVCGTQGRSAPSAPRTAGLCDHVCSGVKRERLEWGACPRAESWGIRCAHSPGEGWVFLSCPWLFPR